MDKQSGYLLEIDSVSKKYGSFQAVDGVEFRIPQKHIFGLLGPNGAGKSTIIRMIMNIILPTSGSILFQGKSISRSFLEKIGYLPEERGLYKQMKVIDILVFLGRLKGAKKSNIQKRSFALLERLGLGDWADRKAGELSKGMQQKIQFIGTILHEPPLIILDEPFSGLDPIASDQIKELILEEKKNGCAIILSTHQMEHAEKLCDSICLLNKGRSLLNGPLSEIKKSYGKNTVEIEYDGDIEFLKSQPYINSINDHGHYSSIHLVDGADPQELLCTMSNRITVHRFEVMEPSLHEIFVDKVGGQIEQA